MSSIKTRGSQETVIAHLVFNLTFKVDRKWGCYTHNFESGPNMNFSLYFYQNVNFYFDAFINWFVEM
jgi:hypothetical protein